MRYDLISLRVFVSVAECRNLTRAAEREHLAVSAVSKRIAELEGIVGIPLLQRYPRGVGLTPAGQSMLHHARQVLQRVDRMDAELAEFAGGVKGHVHLHAVASALTQFLPEEIEAFVSRYPGVRVSLEERTGKAVVLAVLMAEGARACGKPIEQRVQASSFDAMCRLVQTRLGITMLPEGVLAPHAAAGRIRTVRLDEDWALRAMVLVVRDPDSLGHIARALLEHLQQSAAGATG